MYYLNAFNEMLRKRQRQNMMGGEGYQGDAAPSGPMGARQSGGMADVRNALTNMNPFVSAGLSMIPGVGAPLALARLSASAYDRFQANQNPYADDSMDRLSFNAPAYGQAGPEYGPYADDSMDRLSFNAPSPVAPQSSFAGEALAPMAPEAISSPIARSGITGESLAPMAGDFGGRFGGAGGGFGGGVGTGEFGGSPADAADLGYNQGGMVTPERLMGRAPAPDDGYGALQGGEYVITKAAVEKYGKRMMDAINNGTFR
jgi:hypothetical protein